MRYYLLILITLLLTSCSSLQFRYDALTAVSHYDGIYYNKNSKVEVINNDWDLDRKFRTDDKFRWNFAQYAMNQDLRWHYDFYWNNRMYRSPFASPFDFYWNSTQYWWNWSSNYPFNYGFNHWDRFGFYGYGYWNDPFRFGNSWSWGYRPNRWFRYNHNQFIVKPQRPKVVINGRRGSNNNNTNITINRGRSNDNNNVRVRRYDNKDRIVPRRNYNDVKIENRTPIRSNDRIRTTPPNRNSNPIRVNPPTRTPNNVRSTPTRVTRPNISTNNSSSSRNSVGRRGNN